VQTQIFSIMYIYLAGSSKAAGGCLQVLKKYQQNF